jgi:hypothetical protein
VAEPTRYLHDDAHQPTPLRLAQWEEGQVAQRGNVWIDLGSLEGGGYDAIERGVVNLELASRFNLHGEIRNDRNPDGRVTRALVDLLVSVAPGLWLGPSGVPAARKQDYGVGGSALLVDSSRRRFLLARLVADQFLYNRTNVDGGVRSSPVLHAQAQGRWETGPWSLAGTVDATTDSDTTFSDAQLVTFLGTARRELSLHGRYAVPELELDARFDFLHVRDARVELGAPSSLRHTVGTVRFEILLPGILGTRWRPRLGARMVTSDASGQDAGSPYDVTRREPGGRVAAQRDDGVALWELGYLFAVPVVRQTNGGPALESSPYEDLLYGSCDLSFGQIHLRALLSWEPRNARFGGANGNVLMQF